MRIRQIVPSRMSILIGLAAVAAVVGLVFNGLYPSADGAVTPLGSLAEVRQHYGVQPLDPASSVPLAEQAIREVAKTDPSGQYQGITYRLTHGNRLPAGWLVQSPDVWGSSAAAVVSYPVDCPGCGGSLQLPVCRADAECGGAARCLTFRAVMSKPSEKPQRLCAGHSDALIERIYQLVVSAQGAVDIALLQPEADQRFLEGLRNAISWLAHSRRNIDIRILVGTFPPNGSDPLPLMQELTRGLEQAPESNLRLRVATTRSCNGGVACGELTWNHAKIVAIDGKTALVGGHNMWTNDYLLGSPVHDLSMVVEGPAAVDAHRYADALWRYVCGRPADDLFNRSLGYDLHSRRIAADCLPAMTLPSAAAGQGGVAVLSAGRLGAGVADEFADQSLILRDLFLGAATRSIRMVQQDVAFSAGGGIDALWPELAIGEMAALMAERGGDVYLVLSNPSLGEAMAAYSFGTSLEAVAAKFRDAVAAKAGIGEEAATAIVCHRLHLAPMRFGPDATWPEGKLIGVHTKLWIVDDRAFHIGSENLYPVALQEFGYIVEDRQAVHDVVERYWDKAWQWSRSAAVSGADAPGCVLAGDRGVAQSAAP